MARIAEKKEILKDYFFKYKAGLMTQVQIAEVLGCTKQYVSKKFGKFEEFLDSDLEDRRGKPRNESKVDNMELKRLEIKVFLLETIISFLLSFIKWTGQELGLKLNPFKARLSGELKVFLVKSLTSYQDMGGKLMDYAEALGKEQSTLCRWVKLFQEGHSLEDKKPEGRPVKELPRWVQKAVSILKRQYPLASFRGLALLFNCSSPDFKLTPYSVEKALSMEEKRLQEDRQRRKKRYDLSGSNFCWDLDFMEFTVNRIRHRALVVVDHHSRKLLYAKVLLKPTAEKVGEIVRDLGRFYGLPAMVKADNGPEFRKYFKNKLSHMGVMLLNSPLYYPSFNGVVERLIGSIRKASGKMDLDSVRAIDRFLEAFRLYHNDLPHGSLGCMSPFQVFKKGKHWNYLDYVELLKPYSKEGKLCIKFTKRNGNIGKLSIPLPLKCVKKVNLFSVKKVCKVY